MVDEPRDVPAVTSDVEYDATAARAWMVAVAAGDATALTHAQSGVFGSRVAVLDFDPDDLARLRRLLPSVRLATDTRTASAIAISGSSAQGRVQLFPGDTDFFERVHVRATTQREAERVLRDIMHATAVRALAEPDVVLVEVNLGVYPEAVVERGRARAAGDTVTWTPTDVVARAITVERTVGDPLTIAWDDVEIGNGWVYLGWIVADREQGRIALASVMVDATWEDDAGVIRSLDGTVDPVAQEVYLEPEALELVQRLQGVTAPGAREAYRRAMRDEVHHYTAVSPDYAKAAKRLYNLFRVADELEAAAYVRELFDEPTACLYQVPGLLEAADAARDPASGIDRTTVMHQIEVVADAIAAATDGREEARLLAELDRLREGATDAADDGDWSRVLTDVRSRCAEIVSEFFRAQLFAHDRVRAVVTEIARA